MDNLLDGIMANYNIDKGGDHYIPFLDALAKLGVISHTSYSGAMAWVVGRIMKRRIDGLFGVGG